jgi:hypothetical protein
MFPGHLPKRRTSSQSGYVTMAMSAGDSQQDAVVSMRLALGIALGALAKFVVLWAGEA